MRPDISQELKDLGLPKWPCFLVKGEPVTEAQAIEINFRTNSHWWSTNDRAFLEFVAEEIGVEMSEYGSLYMTTEQKQQWGMLDLEYLSNSNIMSSYIGGPHGWCDWRGNIRASSYNIGKWPSVDEVYEEWCNIAEAFPYLDLRCQLLNHETGYPDEDVTLNKAVIEYRIKDGQVNPYVPESIMMKDEGLDFDNFAVRLGDRYREHIPEVKFTELYNRFKQIRGL